MEFTGTITGLLFVALIVLNGMPLSTVTWSEVQSMCNTPLVGEQPRRDHDGARHPATCQPRVRGL